MLEVNQNAGMEGSGKENFPAAPLLISWLSYFVLATEIAAVCVCLVRMHADCPISKKSERNDLVACFSRLDLGFWKQEAL